MERENVSTWLWFVVSVVFIATIIFMTMLEAGAQVGPFPTATPTVMIPPIGATVTPFVPTDTPVPPPTVAPTVTPTPTFVILPLNRFAYLPIGAKP